MTKKGILQFQTEMAQAYLGKAIESLSPENAYSWFLHLYNSFHWQGSTLKSIQVTADYHGLALTFPFWDRHLLRFLSSMPESWGRGLEQRPVKYPLRSMLSSRIDYPYHLQEGPNAIRDDEAPRVSFEAEILYRPAIAPHFKTCMKKHPYEAVLQPEFFNIDYLRKIVNRYVSGEELQGEELNDLYRLTLFSWVGWY